MWRALAVASLLLTTPLPAHEGHDHGPPPPPPATQTLAPRVASASADFELVAILENGQVRVYLDEFATNRPIENAVLELESGSFRAPGAPEGQGVYILEAGPLAQPGRHELVFTVQTPTTADLLLGSLEVPQAAAPGDAATGAGAVPWYASTPLLQGTVVALVVCLLGLLLWRDRRAPPPLAWLAVGLLALAVAPAGAHEGHDHGAPEPASTGPVLAVGAPAGGTPLRLPDGTLFVPKPVQRLLGLRTARAEAGQWPDSFTLTGHVIPDPNASALVQAPLRGRVELPPGGLPQLGAPIRQGQLLAHLAPILDAVDQASLRADLAEVEGRVEILGRDLERLRRLGVNAPRQELEKSEAEHASQLARRKAIRDSFTERIPLTAPVAGVLALREASPGQIVEAGATLFSLVDPQRLWVEALLYDTDHAGHFVSASARAPDGQVLRLSPVGGGRELRGHALPIQFRIEAPPAPGAGPHLVVRQPLTLVAQMHHASAGPRIPRVALQQGTEGTRRVWVHSRPEHFRAQPVQVRDLDAEHVLVTEGLAAGDRVVTEGASLLNQVR